MAGCSLFAVLVGPFLADIVPVFLGITSCRFDVCMVKGFRYGLPGLGVYKFYVEVKVVCTTLTGFIAEAEILGFPSLHDLPDLVRGKPLFLGIVAGYLHSAVFLMTAHFLRPPS